MISTQTRGVGINRNFRLHYADADILLISDDDMVFKEGYTKTVEKTFSELPDADTIILILKQSVQIWAEE